MFAKSSPSISLPQAKVRSPTNRKRAADSQSNTRVRSANEQPPSTTAFSPVSLPHHVERDGVAWRGQHARGLAAEVAPPSPGVIAHVIGPQVVHEVHQAHLECARLARQQIHIVGGQVRGLPSSLGFMVQGAGVKGLGLWSWGLVGFRV